MRDDEEERRIVRELQAKVDREGKQTIEVHLPDPGPYILPRCPRIESTYTPDARTFELFLETEKGQLIRVPIAADQLNGLKLFVDHLVSIKRQP